MRAALVLVIAFLAADSANAQTSRFTAGGEVGVGRTSHDESDSGAGVLTGARASWLMSDRASLELATTRIPHHRTFAFQNFDTKGRSWLTTLSARYDLSGGRVRPFVLAGLGLNQYRGRWADGPERRSTSKGYHGGLGLAVNRGRLQHGVEGRMNLFDIGHDSAPWAIVSAGYTLKIRL